MPLLTTLAERADVLEALGLDLNAPDIASLNGNLVYRGNEYRLAWDGNEQRIVFDIQPGGEDS